ncbi:restriction endonuclease subunit S [Clostridium kluyveri]|uniref:Type I restriction modification DNA specificity domain-containing protein n=1 Tax=Clostridium kluyveri TaxID=1534 RepID=A0A1L5F978_CLOKL|nr:restriction endonuclease subunit S [Clostridium kluyveri]APM39555.1 hypothetical protein BS101_12785 [Clostridium kluyveri]
MKERRLPEGWKVEKLGSLLRIDGGFAFKSDRFTKNAVPIVRIGNIVDGNIELDYNTCYKVNNSEFERYYVNHGDILIAMSGATTGKLAMYRDNQRCLFNQRVGRFYVYDKEKLDNGYLYYYLKSGSVQNKIRVMASGCAQPNISPDQILSIKVLVPLLQSQKKIVQVLEKAEKALEKKKEAIRLLNDLIKSRFIEMFGDPVKNTKGWPKGRIVDVIVKTQYGTGNKADEQNGKYKILRMNNITYNGEWDFSSMKYVDLDEKDQEKYLVSKGEVLFNRTNSKELVGKTAVYKEQEPMAYAGYLVKAIPNEKANGVFIATYMNTKYIKSKLFNMAKNIVGMANINAEEFKKIDIYIPPIELQNQFADFINQVDKLKFKMEESLKELENLFNSLMQKAFRGELEFN